MDTTPESGIEMQNAGHSDQGEGAQAHDAEPVTPEELIAHLRTELAKSQGEAVANWDRFLRERAEMENVKRRLERTFAESARRQQKEVLLKMVGVSDNLDRALSYGDGGTFDTDRLLQGVRLTSTLLRDALTAEGVRVVDAEGQPFDPSVHEAIAREVRPDLADGTVVAELQRGYLFSGELLRPSLVRVAVHE